jgi:hypothetical protein
MRTTLFVAPFVVLPLALLAATVWVVERRLRPNAIPPSKRLLVYFVACLLASVAPAWLLAETYGVLMASRPGAAGRGETWGMLVVGMSSFGTLGFAVFDRARSVWLFRRWAKAAGWVSGERE